MNRIFASLAFLVVVGFQSCTNTTEKPETNTPAPIGPKDIILTSDLMTPEVLWSMGRIGETALSPDKKTILFGLTYYDLEQNKGNSEFYTIPAEGGAMVRLTSTTSGEYNPRWRPDGKKIGFMSAESGSMQLWEMNQDGTGRIKISEVEGGINGFCYAPDQSKIAYIADVKTNQTVADIYPDLPKSSGRVMNDLMYRHWDHWVDSYSHVFVADYNGETLLNAKDVLANEPYETPLAPFGGMEQITWTPDSKGVVYTCRKKTGKEYSFSTNSDIYLYEIATGKTKNLTEGMMGYDVAPVISPDGRFMAWESMERDGFEADKVRLYVLELKSRMRTNYTLKFDQDAHGLAWSDDSKSVYFISNWHALDQIYKLEMASNSIRKITEGVHDYTSVIPAGDRLIGTKMSMSMPTEIFSINESDGSQTQLTFVNKPIFDQLALGKVEERWVETTDHKQMLTWVIYPPHFDPSKKYPTLLYCQGGPQSTVSQFWSYRWNFQMMAANGYIIVAPNRRGLPGFGKEWNEQISGDYGGQNMKDYLSAIDAVAKEPYVNADKLGAVGASYGGFSVYWLAGNHNKRFKAFIAHDGMFNLESQYLETEEMWFVDWDLGGNFWDKGNKIAQNSYANSPHKFIEKWDTPIMVVHSELDYRIVASQGMQAFNAAVIKGIPAEYLYFPDENHWVLKPQNGVLWQRRFYNWLDKWLK
ncbi:MAG: S9 family peptidase [Bacteroidales bacterium]|nr:S9 family peptidase [Bacteroidales bacterium]